ncbi:MAG: NAD(P)-binding domain-containing protein [Cyanobacteria bacterium P01_F01_bin.150]
MSKHSFTYLIIGAGPAGLQMAYFLQKAGIDYLVLEANAQAGSFFQSNPRHRRLISINKRFNKFPEAEFNMRHDWNSLLTEAEDADPLFREYSTDLYPHADALCRYLQDFAHRHHLQIQYNTKISRVSGDGAGGFVVTDTTGQIYNGTRLLMATGVQAPLLPDIEGIELADGYEDYDTDPARFENKTVLVIGRGNSAFEVANNLTNHAAIIQIAIGNRPVDLAWETHSVRNVRAINNTIIEMLHLKSLHGAVGLNVKTIRKRPEGGYTVTVIEELANWAEPKLLEMNLEYDHVICCAGFRYVLPDLFDADIRPAVDDHSKYPILDETWQSTTPGLYFVGTSMAARDLKAASSFIHGFRYNIRSLTRLLLERYHGQTYPRQSHPLRSIDDLRALSTRLLARLSVSAGLYQMYSFLCDAILLIDGGCEIFEEVPVDWAKKHLGPGNRLVLMTFDYGFHQFNEEANALGFITQQDEGSSRQCAAFLHPVFYYYEDGQQVFEDNIGESLFIRYGPFRSISTDEPYEPADDVECRVLMNILNRIVQLTDTPFSEKDALANHIFHPWPADRPLPANRGPMCKLSQ